MAEAGGGRGSGGGGGGGKRFNAKLQRGRDAKERSLRLCARIRFRETHVVEFYVARFRTSRSLAAIPGAHGVSGQTYPRARSTNNQPTSMPTRVQVYTVSFIGVPVHGMLGLIRVARERLLAL